MSLPNRELGDDHYRKIADLREQFGYRYAPLIAAMYGRPVATVHRWVREAKRRGFSASPPEHRCQCRCGRYLDDTP